MKLNHIFRYVIPFVAAFSLIACEDDSISGSTIPSYPIEPIQEPGTQEPGTQEPGTQEPGTQEPGTQEPGTQEPGTQEPGTQEPGTQEPQNAAILLAASATDIEIPYKGFTKAQVLLVGIAGEHAGEGIVGEDIEWSIESGDDIVTMMASTSSTADGGIANMTIHSLGEVGEAVIVAESELAPNPIRFNVTVLPKPTGSMRVTADYNGPANIENYSIALYDGKEVQCAMIDLKDGVDAEPILPKVDEKTTLFENLDIEQRYSLIAYGYADSGAMVAAGCLDSGLNITQDNTLNVTIKLDTIALDPVATYHVRSYFDLGDVVGALGSVGKIITYINGFVDNPAAKAYDLLLSAINSVIPSWIGNSADWLLGTLGLKQTFVSWLNNQLLKSTTVCKVGEFSCHITDMVRYIEFTGNFSVQTTGSVSLRGKDTYTGVASYWKQGCPNTNPNCGRFSFSSDQVGMGADVKFLEGEWEGSLANGYDKLSIESHELELRYGKVVTYLINYVLLPKVADGATSIDQAIANWIDTEGLTTWLVDNIQIFGWGIEEKTARNIANGLASGLSSALNLAEAFTELQEAGSNIYISGTAFIKDTNADNKVDDIISGTWTGSMEIKTTEEGVEVRKTTAVRGVWSGYNKENVTIEGVGMYCTSPKTINADGRLCDFPAIDFDSIKGSGMCTKYSNCAN